LESCGNTPGTEVHKVHQTDGQHDSCRGKDEEPYRRYREGHQYSVECIIKQTVEQVDGKGYSAQIPGEPVFRNGKAAAGEGEGKTHCQQEKHMDICEGKTFLICTAGEAQSLRPFIEFAAAPVIYQNETFVAYGFESSQAMIETILLSRMKLDGARCEGGVFTMEAGGRMRVPTDFREAGTYTLTFVCEGEPAQDSRAAMYVTRNFAVAAEQAIVPGENALTVTLEQDDKYFMILLEAGQADGLEISRVKFEKN